MQPKLTALITIEENGTYFLPDQNLKSFGRSYLYMIMIEKLEAIDRIERIVINTDSQRVRNSYERMHRFQLINTIKKRREDEPPSLEIASDKETAAILAQVQGEHFIRLGSIFPFVKQETIESAIGYYDRYALDPENREDSLFSVSHHYRKLFDNDRDVLREDPPNVFMEDGILHLFNRQTFQKQGNRKVGKSPFAFSIDSPENMAIDTEENYKLACLVEDNRHRFPSLR